MRPALPPELCHHTPFFHHLLASIHSRDAGVSIALCIRVKNPYIEKGTLPATPESTSMYISSSIIFPISSGWNNILTRKWLQRRLNNNIMTYTIKPLCCNVSNLIMTHKWRQIIAWSGEKDSPHTQ